MRQCKQGGRGELCRASPYLQKGTSMSDCLQCLLECTPHIVSANVWDEVAGIFEVFQTERETEGNRETDAERERASKQASKQARERE